MRNYLENYLIEYDFPIESREVFLDAYDKIITNEKSKNLLLKTIKDYEENYDIDFDKVYKEYYKIIQDECGIHPHTTGVIFAVCLSRQVKKYYEERGYTKEMYDCVLADIKYKVLENSPVYKVWGWPNDIWLNYFYKFKRFGWGQVQFNLVGFPYEYHKNGIDLYKGSKVITIHLPMTGQKLDMDEFPNTLKKAAEFFKQFLPEGPIVFYCCSWLVYSGHLSVLKPNSQILRLRNMFEILGESYFSDYTELKRLFHTTDFSDLDALPNQTSLQRHYIEVMRRGEKTGYAYGIYIYEK